MTVVSNGLFWMYTIALLIFWIIVLTTAFNNESNIKNQVSLSQKSIADELKNNQICKNLCQQCGCLAFYCGEECICECNDDHADTECIRQIQVNAQDLNIPFEVLIQGPTVNNFVRNALQFEQNRERKLYGYRNKRSTVTVYKPNSKGNHDVQLKSSSERKTSVKDILNLTNKFKNRRKRSNSNQFDWFSDIRNNLLRPAPLGGHKRKGEEEELKNQMSAPTGTTMSSIFDNSWIFDNTHNILTPRPLNKCKSPKILSNTNHENNVDSSIETINPQFHDKFHDDFADDQKILTNYSDEQFKGKNSFSPEQKAKEESKENLIGSLYSRLYGNDFSRFDEKSSFLSQEHSEDYLTDDRQFLSFKDDLSKAESDKGLFSEEEEEENKLLDTKTVELASTSSQISSPENFRNGLHELRIPWFKPGKLLEKFRRVINQ